MACDQQTGKSRGRYNTIKHSVGNSGYKCIHFEVAAGTICPGKTYEEALIECGMETLKNRREKMFIKSI